MNRSEINCQQRGFLSKTWETDEKKKSTGLVVQFGKSSNESPGWSMNCAIGAIRQNTFVASCSSALGPARNEREKHPHPQMYI